jgi:hypothetical protein
MIGPQISIYSRKMCHALVVTIICSFSHIVYGWTVTDNFNNGVSGTPVYQTSTMFTDAAGQTFYTTENNYEGGKALKLNITQGQDGFGSWGGRMYFPQNLGNGDQIWIRLSVYFPTDFDWTTNYGLKFLRLHVTQQDGTHMGYTDIYIAGDGTYFYQNELYTTPYSKVAFGSGNAIKKGVWETFIYSVKYGTTTSSSHAQFWKEVGGTIDSMGRRSGGHMQLLLDNINDITLKSNTNVLSDFLLFTYWNGNSPKTQHMYVDDVMVSTTLPPELGGVSSPGVSPPKPPSNIN